MIKICFVCHGNICRSPMAEFIMKDIAERGGDSEEFYIESRATHTDEIWNGTGSHIYPPAQDIMRKKHVKFDGGKRAELLDRRDFNRFDYFIGMDRENLRAMQRILRTDEKIHLLLDFTEEGGYVSDPWYTRDFELAYSDIKRGCEALYNKLTQEG